MMTLEQCVEYIIPFVKTVGKKDGKLLLIDNLLIYMDLEESQLLSIVLPQSTGNTIATTRKEIYDTFKSYTDQQVPMMIRTDYLIYYRLLDLYKQYSSMNNSIISLDDLTSDETIAELLRLKSKEGLHNYNLEDKIILPFFYGILPVTKADTLDLRIFPVDDISVASKYTVKKKKLKSDIDIYMRLLLV